MSDDVGMEVGKHVISSGGSVGLFALFTRWMDGRKAEKLDSKLEALSTGFALMTQKLDVLMVQAAKADSMREDLALMKASVQALHVRVDQIDQQQQRKGRRGHS